MHYFFRSYAPILWVLFAWSGLSAQDWLGYHTSNYAGIHAVGYNPAFLAGNNYKLDVSLLAAHLRVQNNFVNLDIQTLLNPEETFSEPNFDERYMYYSDHKDFYDVFVNLHVQAPAFMFQLNERTSFGFAPAIRSFTNVNRIDQNLARLIAEGLDYPPLFNQEFGNRWSQGSTNLWAQYSFTGATTLYDNGMFRLKGGLTLHLLQGLAAGVLYGNGYNYIFHNQDTLSMRRLQGELVLSPALANQNFGFGFDGGPGFGLDAGLILEIIPGSYERDGLIRPKRYQEHWGLRTEDETNYAVRLGISFGDMGFIPYPVHPSSANFEVSQDSIPLSIFDGVEGPADLGEMLEDNFQGVNPNDSTVLMWLPGRIDAFVDVKLNHNLGLHFGGRFALWTGEANAFKSHYLHQFTVTPRWEIKWFGAYSPLSFDHMGLVNWGLSLRAGPVVIGSGDLLSNLLKTRYSGISFHFGLRLLFPNINTSSRNPGCDSFDRSYLKGKP